MERLKGVSRLLKYVLIYPSALIISLQIEYYRAEKRRIAMFLQHKHMEFVSETQKVIEQTGAALQQFATLTTFPSMEEIRTKETRRQLREKCITNGISPQVYNEFYRSVEGTSKGLSLNNMLAMECEKSKERCEGFASVAQLLLACASIEVQYS